MVGTLSPHAGQQKTTSLADHQEPASSQALLALPNSQSTALQARGGDAAEPDAATALCSLGEILESFDRLTRSHRQKKTFRWGGTQQA